MRYHRDLAQPEERLAPPNLCAPVSTLSNLTIPPGPATPFSVGTPPLSTLDTPIL